jgi:formate dehydrogenase
MSNTPRKRKPRRTPKGTQADIDTLKQMTALLGPDPLRRERLIEYLHLVQDRYGHIPVGYIRALAQLMNLPQADIWETASFYAHFDPVREGETPPPPLTVRVCNSLSCQLAGANELLDSLRACCSSDQVRIVRSPCMGRCDSAPAALFGARPIAHASVARLKEALSDGETGAEIPDYEPLDTYLASGGYGLLSACRAGEHTPETIIHTLGRAGLRGMGGAGFPAGQKWCFVRAGDGPRYLAVNADEGEPGTFKDRYYLERRPHLMLEGALIAAWAIEATRVYIYIRDEYRAILALLKTEVQAMEAAGLVEPDYIELRRGAGAYVCGEESAMIESIEGKRGLPRHRPPYVAASGLFGRPTLEHNVETLYWIRRIIERGAEDYAARGRHGGKGLRSFSVSGRVKNPGVYLAPAGITLNELLAGHCGGMADGHELKAWLPGGASGGILPAHLADTPMDFGTLEPYGAFTGSGAIVVLSDKDDLKAVARNLMVFFAEESCGQCSPCRLGCAAAVRLLQADHWDKELLTELGQTMRDASICGLGQAAPNVFESLLRHFPEEVK